MKADVKVFRFNPLLDAKPHYADYHCEYEEGMSVLDILNMIYVQDQSFSYSYCCRNGHCGICACKVNGRTVLSCKYPAEAEMLIEPLDHFTVLKDLTVDRSDFEFRKEMLRLFSDRASAAENEAEMIEKSHFDKFKIVSRCIECYCCLSVCPVYAENRHQFAGPAAMVLEARHYYDPRDELNRDLIFASGGIEACIECGLCSQVCPVGANPCETIAEIKKEIERRRAHGG